MRAIRERGGGWDKLQRSIPFHMADKEANEQLAFYGFMNKNSLETRKYYLSCLDHFCCCYYAAPTVCVSVGVGVQ